ncbi:hypothetical protein M8542_31600 [Amycolatopsis sp. OK19-0408]|uniref:Tryptophan 2,3-dioxygenase n=1 Tax=Amycolatopsis iheyensis TaxID=2945988 RepID=A0A9X2NIK6_9PSEU|nr:hypothetical protein [Amycolatopsis iheyensis]MCR6487385.1 hypothetical protein [Amycolatopsis iheyensis]
MMAAFGFGAWPDEPGVGGIGEAAARGSDRHAAAAAVRRWLAGCPGRIGASAVAGFPFAPVLRHYRAAGRGYAGDELGTLLRTVHSGLPGGGAARLAWPLPDWLPCPLDRAGGGYDGYLALPLLESPAGADLPPHRAAADLLRALAADLLALEVRALGARPGRAERQRVRACLGVLARLLDTDVALPSPASDEDLADLAEVWVAEALEPVAARVRVVTELSLLPMTPLHDEQMFLRCLQLFETLYRRIGDALVAARDALVRRAVDRARVLVAEAVRLLALSPPLHRVVTTMPPAVFAVIRAHTGGRSAVQSRGYRRIEDVSAGLQDAVVRLGESATSGVRAELARLDEAWCAMKRTHWGITLKIIGTAPGTGGTSGADYLRQAAAVPLFPALAARPLRVGA